MKECCLDLEILKKNLKKYLKKKNPISAQTQNSKEKKNLFKKTNLKSENRLNKQRKIQNLLCLEMKNKKNKNI